MGKGESENSKIRKITSLFDRVSTSATASNEANSKGQIDTGDNDIGLVVSETEIESQECTKCSSTSGLVNLFIHYILPFKIDIAK